MLCFFLDILRDINAIINTQIATSIMNDINDIINDIKGMSYIIEHHCHKHGGSVVLFLFIRVTVYSFHIWKYIYPFQLVSMLYNSRQSKVTRPFLT